MLGVGPQPAAKASGGFGTPMPSSTAGALFGSPKTGQQSLFNIPAACQAALLSSLSINNLLLRLSGMNLHL